MEKEDVVKSEVDGNEISVFHQTVLKDGDDIFIKPLCDLFQINYENQARKISKDSILKRSSTKKSNKLIFGDNIPRIAVTKRGFIRWIQLMNPSIVQVDLRKKFEIYQEQIFDFLYDRAERQEDQARISYNRLNKLKRLYGKIGNEIQNENKNLFTILDSKYLQTSIPFNRKKK